MMLRLKRRLAPWIAWRSYQRLTLSWPAAKFAQGVLGEPPMALRVRALARAELERFAEEPAYGISPRFLERLKLRTDLCEGGFVGAERFPVLRLRSRAYPLATPRAEPSNFFIHRTGSGPALA
jgi:hypothetical protein